MSTNPNAPSNTRIVLHHLENSRSQRILWLLEELGCPYTLKVYKRQPNLFAPPELREIHHSGLSPVLTDGDLTIAESGAIIDYLILHYGKGRFAPAEGAAWVTNSYYSHYAEGGLMPIVNTRFVLSLMPQRLPSIAQSTAQSVIDAVISYYYDPNLKKAIDHLGAHIKSQPNVWLTGSAEPTAADFMMGFSIERVILRCPEFVDIKSIEDPLAKYAAKLHSRPAYQRALEKDQAYKFVQPPQL